MLYKTDVMNKLQYLQEKTFALQSFFSSVPGDCPIIFFEKVLHHRHYAYLEWGRAVEQNISERIPVKYQKAKMFLIVLILLTTSTSKG